MAVICVAYRGTQYFAYVHDPRGLIIHGVEPNSRDVLSLDQLTNFLLDVKDGGYNAIIPMPYPPPGYTSVNQHYYDTELHPKLRSRGITYRFSPRNPIILEAEKVENKD